MDYGFFSIQKIAFNWLGYSMSWLELFGTLFNIASVWLVVRKSVWNWVVGNIGVVLFTLLFIQVKLTTDVVEQGYFFLIGFYGWWAWARHLREHKELQVRFSGSYAAMGWLIVTLLLTVVVAEISVSLPQWLPSYFPQAPELPWFDSTVTAMSVTGTILLARRRTESWVYWIAIDVVCVGLYASRQMLFLTLLYLVFLGLAVTGLIRWILGPQEEAA